jgi:hypothetical protein
VPIGGGLLALAFYAVHTVHHLRHHQPENALWACHLASVLVGAGLVFRSPSANAIGFLWLVLGVPLWLTDLAGGAPFLATSLLTHVGGFVLALYGLALLGMPEHAWWKAIVAFVALQQVTRVLTPPAANVNLAFAVWPGWEGRFASYRSYEAMLVAAGLVGFFVVERVTRRAAAALQRVRFDRAGRAVS